MTVLGPVMYEHYKTAFDTFLWRWRGIRGTKDEKVESLMLYKDWIDEEIAHVEKAPDSD